MVEDIVDYFRHGQIDGTLGSVMMENVVLVPLVP